MDQRYGVVRPAARAYVVVTEHQDMPRLLRQRHPSGTGSDPRAVHPRRSRSCDRDPLRDSRWPEVEEILADYFAGGTRLVWVVEPHERRIIVRYPHRAPRILAGEDIVEGEDVVP